MGKKAQLDIQESMSELRKMLAKRKSLQEEKRIKCLIAIKSGKFGTRQKLADYSGIHIRALERWLNSYKSDGIFEMLSDKPKKKAIKNCHKRDSPMT